MIQGMALNFVGVTAVKELIEGVFSDLVRLAFGEGTSTSPFVRKKAILCVLRIYKKFTDKFLDITSWLDPLRNLLRTGGQSMKHLSLMSATVSMIHTIASLSPTPQYEIFVDPLINTLMAVATKKDVHDSYLYYTIPNPWLQVKIIKTLAILPVPVESASIRNINDFFNRIIAKSKVSSQSNRNNIENGILFETIDLLVKYRDIATTDIKNQAISLVVVFLSLKEANIRYLSLDAMTRVIDLTSSDGVLSDNLKHVFSALRDQDLSIRRRALDLLYLMCGYETAGKIVEDLLNYAEENDAILKEEVVLKIAILVERFAPSLSWYIDVVIRMLSRSGDYVSNDIWYRIIQIITGFGHETDPELQKYAANQIYIALNVPNVHDALIKLGCYILAEFGRSIVAPPYRTSTHLFEVINRHFSTASTEAKCMMLSSYAKLAHMFRELRETVMPIFEFHTEHIDPEIQQRASDYLHLFRNEPAVEAIRGEIFIRLPTYSLETQNSNPLIKKMITLKLGGLSEKDSAEARSAIEGQMDKFLKTANRSAGPPGSQSNEEFINLNKSEIQAKFSDMPLFSLCKGRLALTGTNTIMVLSEMKLPSANPNEFKNLFTTSTGTLYQDSNLLVEYKCDFEKHQGKVAMQFKGKSGPLTNVSLSIPNIPGVMFNISPINYAEHPQVIVLMLCNGLLQSYPMCKLSFLQNGTQRIIDFGIPVSLHKFMQHVDLPEEKYHEFYEEFTNSNRAPYYRIDEFIRNPAPPSVPLTEMMKKVGMLLNNGLNLKASASPDFNNIRVIWASGQYSFKPEGSTNLQTLPVIVEVEGNPKDPEYLRLSIRVAGKVEIAKSLYQIMMVFLGN